MKSCSGEEQLKALQEEQRKIEAFQRELPLCMHLLTQAIEVSREKLRERAMCYSENQHYSNPQHSPKRPLRLEEFIPLKKRLSYHNNVHTPHDIQTKEGDMNWIHQAHGQQGLLFSPGKESNERKHILKPCLEGYGSDCDRKPFFHSKQRVRGGAFLPFSLSSKEREALQPRLPESMRIDITSQNNVEPSRRNNDFETMGNLKRREISKEEGEEDDDDGDDDEVVLVQGDRKKDGILRLNNTNGVRGHRKGRRCWSPELHRQFVSALVQLGGSLVATPKKIREVMKVDGLTNDEVKSHLQKYRLHSRRQLNPCPTTTSSSHSQQLVVLGSIWMPSPPLKYNATSLCTPQTQQSSMVTHNICNTPSRETHPQLHLHLSPSYSNDHLRYREAVSHHYPTTQSSVEVEGTDEDISKGSDTTLEF